MGVRVATGQTNLVIASPTANTETVIATVPPLNLVIDTAIVLLQFMLSFQGAVGAAVFTINIRTGTTTGGPAVGFPWTITTVNPNVYIISGFYFHSPGAVAAMQYSLTGLSGPGVNTATVLDVNLLAMVL